MGKSNKDAGIVQPRPSRHQQARPHVDGLPSMRHSHSPSPSPHTAVYTLNGTSYYPHPCSYHGKGPDDRCENSDGGSRRGRPGSSSKLEGLAEASPISVIPVIPGKGTTISVNAELKVSIAAKHLADQINESKKFWVTFQEQYEREVTEIKYYAGDDILQQIWRKRIDYNSKYKNGENQDDEEFSIQRMKLEACLDQVNEAAKGFVQSCLRDDHSNHDPRHIALEKIRSTGALVLDLAAKSALNSGACANLVTEASNLEKLVDSKSQDARILHRFDRRQSKASAHENENENEKRTSTAPAPPGEGDDMLNLGIGIAGE
ncbi:hypothetical protein F4776DRAFT_668307 [Hypoxylon sp. NC0597]|nr:hypothetical protein F4776DRAFT_668307 [Hypoxylon sp. NC0597]